MIAHRRLAVAFLTPVMLAVSSLAEGAGGAVDGAASAYDCAVSHIERQEFDAAARLLEAELERSPRDLKALNLLGIALTGAGRTDEGSQRFREALDIDPRFHPARKNLGVNELNEGRHAEAKRHFEEVLAHMPDDEIAHLHVAEIHFHGNDLGAAISHYEKSRTRVVQNPTWTLHYATALLHERQRDQAIALLDTLPEDDAESRFEAGLVLGRSGAHAAAARFFGTARAVSRNPYAAGYNQTLMLIEAGDHDGAIRVAEELVDHTTNPGELYNLMSRAYLGAGRIEEAYDALRHAARLQPTVEEHYLDLALIGLDHENFDLGLEIVEVGLRYLPRSKALYLQRGVLLAMKGLVEEAATEFEKAHELAPDASAPFYALALAWMTMGQADKAVAVLRERIGPDPTDAMLPYVFGLALMRTGADPAEETGDEAVRAFSAAVRLDPQLADARTELGKLLLRRGDLPDAIAELEQAVALDPGGVAPAYALAQAYRRTGELERARALLDRVRTLHAQERDEDPDRHLTGIVLRIVRDESTSTWGAAGTDMAPSGATVTPETARAHLQRGRDLEQAGKRHDALDAYQQALRMAPDLAEARYELSGIAAAMGDRDGAIRLLRAVTASTPDLADAHYNLAVNLWNRTRAAAEGVSTEDLDEAQAALTRAVELDADRPRFHLALGQLLAERQQLAPAVSHLGRAAALAPADADYAYNVGLALRLQGDLDGAGTQFRAALRLDAAHALARRSLGLVLRQQGALAAAATELRRAAAERPEDARGLHLLGTVLLKLDDLPGAIEQLREAIRLDPSLTDARTMLAQALARSGQGEAAREEQAEVRRLVAERADFGRALVLLDVAANDLAAGHWSQAIVRLHEAVELSPDFADAHYQLAVSLRHLGQDLSEAESALRRVLALDPNHARAHYELGRLLAERDDRIGAIEALRHATRLAPSLVGAHRELARLAAETKEWPTAVSALQAVIAWDTGQGSAEAREALAVALDGMGAHDEAERERAIARTLSPGAR